MNTGRHAGFVMLAGMLVAAGCAGATGSHDVTITYRALEDTDRGRIEHVEHGSQVEQDAIERFKEFYRIFSAERIAASMERVYAENAYFEDGLRQVRGRERIKEYFLSTTSAFTECTFDIKDMAYSQGNYYFRWIMHLRLKRDPDHPMEQPGMSHVRFDEQGRVVFHHDYWETLALFERFPVIGRVIRFIKSRI
ncbi:MAG TPA: nuclear transport factor 2 family protein [Deltaproteobacteria bacterium]|nr:nuclear transport factor 2 family protein [Deltaproteobacteria bacterium]HOM28370.1 nuclear transport factor 2 family protein [Deltaproteobacteria bacterium]HPP80020.1 nuclear transport factor 2 family protein [Deltaproteobacteria bacterium]